MKNAPQPRTRYDFEKMEVNEVKRIVVSGDDLDAGSRARCAAYAFGRRNNRGFCGAVLEYRGKTVMAIRRIK